MNPPDICAACRCLMHLPTETCPEPYVCTYAPGECGQFGCVNYPTPEQTDRLLSSIDKKVAQFLANNP